MSLPLDDCEERPCPRADYIVQSGTAAVARREAQRTGDLRCRKIRGSHATNSRSLADWQADARTRSIALLPLFAEAMVIREPAVSELVWDWHDPPHLEVTRN